MGSVEIERPQMWVRPQLPFGRSRPSPDCNWRTLPSSHNPSLPTLCRSFLPMLYEGAAQAGVGMGSLDPSEWRGRPPLSCTRLRVPPVALQRVAADFLDFIAFCRCSTVVALHPLKILVSHLPPLCAGRCRTEIWV